MSKRTRGMRVDSVQCITDPISSGSLSCALLLSPLSTPLLEPLLLEFVHAILKLVDNLAGLVNLTNA